MPGPFEQLDFVYMPSADVAADVDYFTRVVGAQLGFAIEAFGTRVAMVRLSDEPPALLFAGHLAGERPVLVYRVENLDSAIKGLEERGWEAAARFGIPHGPCCENQAASPLASVAATATTPSCAAGKNGTVLESLPAAATTSTS